MSEVVLSSEQHLARVKERTEALAIALREATDAGVSHALILPQMMVIFREQFGSAPEGFQLPGLGGLLG